VDQRYADSLQSGGGRGGGQFVLGLASPLRCISLMMLRPANNFADPERSPGEQRAEF
jgi:hypothetical protein